VGAYAVCLREGSILLARGMDPATGNLEWTLPGGGLQHGEDPTAGAVREVAEETGYDIGIDALLTIDSRTATSHHMPPYDVHMLRIVYSGTVLGGELRFEVGGSTDQAAWVPLDEVPRLARLPFVDVGLAERRRYDADPTAYSTSTP
jgi:ADP-ribose pyrophosphatase YjhB (NUDIX family)